MAHPDKGHRHGAVVDGKGNIREEPAIMRVKKTIPRTHASM
jgi:hypothetical protein